MISILQMQGKHLQERRALKMKNKKSRKVMVVVGVLAIVAAIATLIWNAAKAITGYVEYPW
jgi:uncharacterized membrane protein HdeD (DUF308 family)